MAKSDLKMPHLTTNEDLIPIYTDWANHYLEKSGKKRCIRDLQHDMQDCGMLVDVLEAVTNQKVAGLSLKSKASSQGVDNVAACLKFLHQLGVDVDGLQAKDIRDGHLKSILGLFFSLSRFKQHQKALAHPAQPVPAQVQDMSSKLPSPFKRPGSAPKASHLPAGKSAIARPPATGADASPARSLQHDAPRKSSQPKLISAIPAPNSVGRGGQTGLRPPSASGSVGKTGRIDSSESKLKASGLQPPTSTSLPRDSGPMLDKFKFFGKQSDKNSGGHHGSNQTDPQAASSSRVQAPSSKTARKSQNPSRLSNSSSGVSSATSTLASSSRLATSGGSGSGRSGSGIAKAPSNSSLLTSSQEKSGSRSNIATKKPGALRSPKGARRELLPPGSSSSLKAPKSVLDPKSAPTPPPTTTIPARRGSQPPSPPKRDEKTSLISKPKQLSMEISSDSAYGESCASTLSSDVSSNKDKDASSGLNKLKMSRRYPPLGAADGQIPAPSAGVPKPTLVVRGTAIGDGDTQGSKVESAPDDQERIIPGAPSGPIRTSPSESKAQDVPLKDPPVGKPPKNRSTSPVNIGVVSPMTHHKELSINNRPMTYESSFDALGGHQSDASNTSSSGDTASVIYCPSDDSQPTVRPPSGKKHRPTSSTTCEPQSKIVRPSTDGDVRIRNSPRPPHRTNSRVETTFELNDAEPVTKLIEVESNRVDKSQDDGKKESKSDSERKSSEEGEEPVGVQPMEPLLRPDSYSPRTVGLNLGNAPSIGHSLMLRRHLGSNYAPLQLLSANLASTDPTHPDLTSAHHPTGYVSDTGDMMTHQNDVMAHHSDVMNAGYVSESGISLYVQRMRERFKEGLEIARDSMRKDAMHDSFEDSSSLSSEISENIDEISTDDLTGSSLSDNQFANALKFCQYPGSGTPSKTKTRQIQAPGSIKNNSSSKDTAQVWAGKTALNRPKSEQMNHGGQKSQDTSLRGPPTTFRQPPAPAEPTPVKSPVAPVTGIPRPGSSASKPSYQSQPGPGQYNSLSLDRKRQVLTQFSTPELTSYEGEGFYHMGNVSGISPSTLAMVSPRHTLVKNQNGQIHMAMGQNYDYQNGQMRDYTNQGEVRMRHSLAGHPQYAALMAAQQLPRSGSSRSCKSESPYASLITRTGDPQNSSPRHKSSNSSGYSVKSDYGVSSPARIVAPVQPFTTTPANTPYVTNVLARVGMSPAEADGSQWSLNSSASLSNEERYQAEIRKLSREIDQYKDKVQTLMTQQNTYDSVVSAFEHSLEAMKRRLHTLMNTSEQKDHELADVHDTLNALYEMCKQSGISVETVFSPHVQRRQNSEPANGTPPGSIARHLSNESLNSLVSQRSSISNASSNTPPSGSKLLDKKAKKSWLRSSFTKAFTKSRRTSKQGSLGGSLSDVEEDSCSAVLRQARSQDSRRSQPASPMHTPRTSTDEPLKRGSIGSNSSEANDVDLVLKLKKELEAKDSALTDLRLEALTAAHQLDQVKEELSEFKNKIGGILPADVRASSQSSLLEHLAEAKLSLSDKSVPQNVELTQMDTSEGHPVKLVVNLGYHGDAHRFLNDFTSSNGDFTFGSVRVGPRMKWNLLDSVVEKSFKECVMRIDPETNLGLSAESIVGYCLGQTLRAPGMLAPQLLPSDVVGALDYEPVVRITLKGVKQNATDSLAFESLIPKNNMQRVTAALLEQRRVLLNGPSGTGKTFIATRLAHYIATRLGRDPNDGCIRVVELTATNKTSLKTIVQDIADRVSQSNGNIDSPLILVLDNLHHEPDLPDAFSPLLAVRHLDCPYIIGTTHSSCSTTALQVHHSFRVQLWGNHMEPVHGFLGRFLRQKLMCKEVDEGTRFPELRRVIKWLPTIWSHMNKFLEEVSRTSEVTIGPKIFLTFPFDVDRSRDWFIELWNHSIVPYMLETAKEARKVNPLFINASTWKNPVEEVSRSWPWAQPPDVVLAGIRLEDVGTDVQPPILHPPPPLKSKSPCSIWNQDDDPLIQLMRLRAQEAAEEAGRDNGVSAC